MASAKPQQLVKYITLGKAVKDTSGAFPPGKHVMLCQYLAEDHDKAASSYKTRINDIMTKAAGKLTMGKRMCLTSDDPGTDYELHLLAEEVDENPGTVIFYFVVTDSGFGKAHSITKLLADFKAGIYESGAATIATAGGNGLQTKMLPNLKTIAAKYATNKVQAVTARVEEVKAVMRDNIDLAVKNVDKLSDMEDKSADLDRDAARFARNATTLDRQMKCKNIKLILIGVILVVAVLTAIIYPLAKR